MTQLEQALGYVYQDRSLMETALSHSSYANERYQQPLASYERLEFLGDSILGFVTAEYLYRTFLTKPEGELTRIRAELVCEKNLAQVARSLHLGDHLLLGHGEMQTGGRDRSGILCDVMESLIAAAYLDGGFAAAKGIDPYKKPTENVMGLLNLHDSTRMHFIVNKASGITSLAQIKEKKMPIRISMSHTAGNSYLFGKWILEEYGISQQDITAWGGKIYTPSTNDAASMMKDGQLDVALWIGPGEAFIVQDMMNSVDLDILPVDENVIKAVGEKYGLQRDVIPASFYGGKFGKDIVTVSASTELMINKNVSEDIAYKMVKAMCEKRDDIVIASPFWKSFMPEKAGQGLALPLHPGAAKYYKEKGWL